MPDRINAPYGLPCDPVRSFAKVVRRSGRHGTPLALQLAAQAVRARHLRQQPCRTGLAPSSSPCPPGTGSPQIVAICLARES
jgi:hypothetical protein